MNIHTCTSLQTYIIHTWTSLHEYPNIYSTKFCINFAHFKIIYSQTICKIVNLLQHAICNFFYNQSLIFKSLLVKEKTGSSKGAAILKEWDRYLPLFWQLVPPSEEDTPEACAAYEATTAAQVTLQSA